jgi:hypothetical protein
MKNQEKMTKIIEWLYVNDGMFKSKNEWREKFVRMLRESLCDGGDTDFLRGQLGISLASCTCHNATGGYCPVHNLNKPL